MSIFKRPENISFKRLTLRISGMAVEVTEYELLKTENGMNAALYFGRWQYDELIARRDCLRSQKDCPADEYERFNTLLNSLKVVKWNGRSYNNPMVLDGESFSLEIELSDGRILYCHGTNSWPDGYRTLESAVRELFA